MRKKSVTIKDVAKLAGVSTTTVSYVINKTGFLSEQTRSRVLKAINELGYHPNIVARSLRSRKTSTVGLIICDLRNPFFAEVLWGIETYLGKKGYDIIVTNTDYSIDKEKKSAEMFCSKQVDGVIFVPGGDTNEHVKFLVERGIPVVLLDKRIQNLNVDVVLVNNVEGSRKLVEHLISLGHKRIGIVTGPLSSTTGKERLEGYLKTLREHSMPEDNDLIKIGDFKKQSGYLLTSELLSLNLPPTVIFACNNLIGFGVMEALKERKIRIPEEIGLVIFDDLPWFRYVDPPLTCVAQPSFKLGEIAGKLLFEQMRKRRKKPKEVVLDVQLKIRQSAGELARGFVSSI
ncbi:LacI family DNA-binding transcriptional regulator [Candidatus Aerophobetes bacterium]|nr:LacI family DNA-binding transcriptional regulator [Candidatus Aerophobetes bacterium]